MTPSAGAGMTPSAGAGMTPSAGAGPTLSVTPVTGLPEITAGADLAALIADAAPDLRDGDILVVTSKIVSKAEGRMVTASREQAIEAETARVVAPRRAPWCCCRKIPTSRPGGCARRCRPGPAGSSGW